MGTAVPPLDRRPAYLPAGYALRHTFDGGREPALGWDPEQTLLVYTTGWSPDELTSPLLVCVGRAGAPDLIATSPAYAEPLDIGVAGVAAVYHDGLQVARLDAGSDFAGVDWRRGEVHSLTARSDTGTFAVRGPRSLPQSELVATLRSLSPGT